MKDFLRQMPPVHELQRDERFEQLILEHGVDAGIVTQTIQKVLGGIRQTILNGEWEGPAPGDSSFTRNLFKRVSEQLEKQQGYTLKRVINGTGTILHTNLGRARLSDRAVQHIVQTAQHYSNLEYNLERGERGSRHTHAEELLKEITGAEAAMVVNNNAAAVFLILKALAEKKEVIVSRGQLVEIGGSFRISSIMEESGAELVEVGTTNKTHKSDYEQNINENTAMILKVHTSNFKILGFTKTVETAELAEIAQRHEGVVFYEDLGSGAMYDFQKHGIGDEPLISEVLKKGADIVSFSGDKLLGGPQAGLIVGRKDLIEILKKHQLARVLRVDKMTLAAIEGTLADYVRGESGIRNIPSIRDLLATPEYIKRRAEKFIEYLEGSWSPYRVRILEGTSQVGGGTMPDVELPTFLIGLSHPKWNASALARKLRLEASPAVIVRIQQEEVQIDLRTVKEEEEKLVVEALKAFCSQ
ncbi:L-seryl-tRNA(Sec) selenium transferase [Mesobacillus foraminis]|uniref:L-seryl-tRNA(Sec) selenium transferase n=1 Tax=Mesobacillus foraminis TaxID=279826 RepID=UPI001BE64144|nr:L-seryl-tRNA(Sec) selenium transferase [Mesobacillus foraminis]MBT2755082.1 L-seryl-tRNA(Sec) selenium transferase [Mesobacillus foraminis]